MISEFLSQIKKSQVTEFRLHATYTVDDDDEFHETMEVPTTPSGDADGADGMRRHPRSKPAPAMDLNASGGKEATAGGAGTAVAARGGLSAIVGLWIFMCGILLGMMLGEKLQVHPIDMVIKMLQ